MINKYLPLCDFAVGRSFYDFLRQIIIQFDNIFLYYQFSFISIFDSQKMDGIIDYHSKTLNKLSLLVSSLIEFKYSF